MVKERTYGDALRRVFQAFFLSLIGTIFVIYQTDENIKDFIGSSWQKGALIFLKRIELFFQTQYFQSKMIIIIGVCIVLWFLIYKVLDFLSKQMGVKNVS